MATAATNLDINSIVSQLMTVERQPIAKLAIKEASYQAKLSAYGSVKGAVGSFQSAVQSLNSASNFQPLKATASDATVFSATAASTAVAGTYTLEVSSLARPAAPPPSARALRPPLLLILAPSAAALLIPAAAITAERLLPPTAMVPTASPSTAATIRCKASAMRSMPPAWG